MPIARIEFLDREGRGVAHVDGKDVSSTARSTGEEVEYSVYRRKPPGAGSSCASRRRPRPGSRRAALFSGPARLLDAARRRAHQVRPKQRVLEDALCTSARSARGDAAAAARLAWEYRHARACRPLVDKKGGSLVGFRERKVELRRRHDELRGPASQGVGPHPALRTLIDTLALRERIRRSRSRSATI